MFCDGDVGVADAVKKGRGGWPEEESAVAGLISGFARIREATNSITFDFAAKRSKFPSFRMVQTLKGKPLTMNNRSFVLSRLHGLNRQDSSQNRPAIDKTHC